MLERNSHYRAYVASYHRESMTQSYMICIGKGLRLQPAQQAYFTLLINAKPGMVLVSTLLLCNWLKKVLTDDAFVTAFWYPENLNPYARCQFTFLKTSRLGEYIEYIDLHSVTPQLHMGLLKHP